MELPSEVFAIALHPNRPLLATGVLEGHVSCYVYDLEGKTTRQWHTKRHKGSCRGLEFSPDGKALVSVGKDGVIKLADSETGKVVLKDTEAHTHAIDVIKYVNENIFVTGDDVGVIRVLGPRSLLRQAWDTRTLKPTQTYPETHTDHITSLLPLPNINPYHIISTSGDCRLSVLDIRKSSPISTSEDQEDELLCSSLADDSRRVCIGTQSGYVTLWKMGEWMDHVDRVAPAKKVMKGDEAPSIDCLLRLDDEVIVGASDGSIRRLGFRPNAFRDKVGSCEDGITSLAVVPQEDGWIASASGTKVSFWSVNAVENMEEKEDENRKRKRPKKKSKGLSERPHAIFEDLD